MVQRHIVRTVAAVCTLVMLSAAAPLAGARPVSRGPLVTSMTATLTSDTSSASALETVAASAGLRSEVLQLALAAHARATAEGRTTSKLLTVIDYSLRSRERRLWVLDLERAELLAHELVAHGRNTGDDAARVFSNRSGSNQSSLGTFVTGATYQGKHGLSLRLHGLDGGLNDQALARAIVIHGADYVNEGIVSSLGRLGRSQGCPALSTAAAPRVIDLIRDGTVVFSYYPAPELERAGAGQET